MKLKAKRFKRSLRWTVILLYPNPTEREIYVAWVTAPSLDWKAPDTWVAVKKARAQAERVNPQMRGDDFACLGMIRGWRTVLQPEY